MFYFNADPDPAFHIYEDPDPDLDPASKSNADPDPQLIIWTATVCVLDDGGSQGSAGGWGIEDMLG